MAWYRPLQRIDGRWDYTISNDAGTFPAGFCGAPASKPFYSLDFSELTPIVRGIYGTEERWEAEKLKHAANLHRYHNDGHATAGEAVECYRQYEVLEHLTRGEDEKTQKPCGICAKWTQGRVLVGSGIHREYPICDECFSPDNVLKLHKD